MVKEFGIFNTRTLVEDGAKMSSNSNQKIYTKDGVEAVKALAQQAITPAAGTCTSGCSSTTC